VKLSAVVFVSAEEIERVHELVIQASGGSFGLRDRGLLASAAAAPCTWAFGALAYPTLAMMAAALAFALAKNHAFVDGNKRIAFEAARLFLAANGATFRHSLDWVAIIVQVASGHVTREDLAASFAREMGADVTIDADD